MKKTSMIRSALPSEYFPVITESLHLYLWAVLENHIVSIRAGLNQEFTACFRYAIENQTEDI